MMATIVLTDSMHSLKGASRRNQRLSPGRAVDKRNRFLRCPRLGVIAAKAQSLVRGRLVATRWPWKSR